VGLAEMKVDPIMQDLEGSQGNSQTMSLTQAKGVLFQSCRFTRGTFCLRIL